MIPRKSCLVIQSLLKVCQASINRNLGKKTINDKNLVLPILIGRLVERETSQVFFGKLPSLKPYIEKYHVLKHWKFVLCLMFSTIIYIQVILCFSYALNSQSSIATGKTKWLLTLGFHLYSYQKVTTLSKNLRRSKYFEKPNEVFSWGKKVCNVLESCFDVIIFRIFWIVILRV